MREFLLKITHWFLNISMILVLFLAYMYYHLPDVSTLTNITYKEPLKVFTSQGDLIAEFGQVHRIPAKINEIPKLFLQALVVTEDQRFYEHHGVDPIGIARAASSLFLTRQKRQGASTITMQVARNFFLSSEKTYLRKINEVLLAIAIEKNLSKEDILELYCNKIFLGQRAYGVKAAARNYFGKKLDELTLAEMAMLAGLPKAPSKNNPVENQAAAIKRRNFILGKMFDKKIIDRHSYEQALQEDVVLKRQKTESIEAGYVAEQVRLSMYENFGQKAYEEGFKVYTTIDTQMQLAAQEAVSKGLDQYDARHDWHGSGINLKKKYGEDKSNWKRHLEKTPITPTGLIPGAVLNIEENVVLVYLADGRCVFARDKEEKWFKDKLSKSLHYAEQIMLMQENGSWFIGQVPKVQGALVSIDPRTGRLKALVGGYQFDRSHFNRATQAYRQPASSIKPFLYSMALENGYSMASIINDSPIVEEDMHGDSAYWRPNNVDKKFKGPISLRKALTLSRNLVTIRLMKSIGTGKAIDFLESIGFDKERQFNSLSLSLGTGLVTPLQLAKAYSIFSNEGVVLPVKWIDKIQRRVGELDFNMQEIEKIESELLPLECAHKLNKHVIKPSTAYIIADVLHDVVQYGTGRGAKKLKRADVYGKTGTTNDFTDAWFSGFNGGLVTVVWTGYDELKPLEEFGSKVSLPIWVDYMGKVLPEKEHMISRPKDVVSVRVNKDTGLVADPEDGDTIFEIFSKESRPKKNNKKSIMAKAMESRESIF